jgi:hypothetical protein
MDLSKLVYSNELQRIKLEKFDSNGNPIFSGCISEGGDILTFRMFYIPDEKRWAYIDPFSNCSTMKGLLTPKKRRGSFFPTGFDWYDSLTKGFYIYPSCNNRAIKFLVKGYQNEFKNRIVLYSRKNVTPENKKMIEQICRILGLISALLEAPLPKEMTEEICKSLYLILT